MPSDRVLIFARRPAASCLKPGLTPLLAPEDAAAVYEACLRDLIGVAARERGRIELWYEEEPAAAAYFAAQFPYLPRLPQVAGSLARKLRDAFGWSLLNDGDRAVVLGSDSPVVPEGALGAAFDDLEEADLVVGPVRAGGCYLIGIRGRAWPQAALLLENAPWGSRQALRALMARAAGEGQEVRVLPGWYGLDRIEDLRRAREDARPDSHLARWLAGPAGQPYIAG